MIYFAQCSGGGPIKIGFTSREPENRVQDLQNANPYELVLLGTISGGKEEEAKLHGRFSDDRLRGEWFAPSEHLRSWLRDLGFKPQNEACPVCEANRTRYTT